VIPFTVNGLGAAYGFDVFATGATANGRVIENGLGYSAAMYMGTNGAASGAAIVAANETFHVSYTPWAAGFNVTNAAAAVATKLGGNYIRAAYTPTVANWDLGVGIQNFSGNSLSGVSTVGGVDLGALKRDSLTIVDFQGQGEVAAMPIGIYGSYGWANGQTAGAAVNAFNAGTERKSYFGVLADLGVIPNTLNLQFGLARAKTGVLGVVSLANESDNSYTMGVRYKLAQNAKLGLAYTKFSGTAYDLGGSGGASGAGNGTSLLNMIFSTAF